MVAAGAEPADRPRAQATSSVTLGRSCGLGLRQRTTTSRNAGEKSGGSTMASLGSPEEGGRRVSASNRLTPSAQMSSAVELLPCRASGGSYTVGVLALIVRALTRRIVSLASFS